jgi:hypothetical protein
VKPEKPSKLGGKYIININYEKGINDAYCTKCFFIM